MSYPAIQVKLSKNQISEKFQSGGFFNKFRGPLLQFVLPLANIVPISPVKSVLVALKLRSPRISSICRYSSKKFLGLVKTT